MISSMDCIEFFFFVIERFPGERIARQNGSFNFSFLISGVFELMNDKWLLKNFVLLTFLNN